MAISADSMTNALSRARYLMSKEGEEKIKEIRSNPNYNPEYSTINLDESFYNGNYDYQQMINEQMAAQQNKPAGGINSKLPKAILESMLTEEIDVSALNPNSLDNITKRLEQQAPVKNIVKEEKILYPNNTGVDYNQIKAIIEECIDKKFKELNENTLTGIKLKEGKIALLDNAGNIFHANLEYKGKKKK